MANAKNSHPRRWYHALGPGLITACVVIGPGSILTSSKVGASQGFAVSWVVIASVIFMLAFTTMAARLGVMGTKSPGEMLTQSAGRWLAVLIGGSVFFIASAFQFGNNLGVHTAFNAYWEFDYIVIVFNAAAIAFLFIFKNLYRALEKLMMGFVALMLVAFAANLSFAAPDLAEWAAGFIPQAKPRLVIEMALWISLLAIAYFGREKFWRTAGDSARWKNAFVVILLAILLLWRLGQLGIVSTAQAEVDISVLGLVGTTFVIAAAYFQVFLVRQKGVQREDLPNTFIDSRVGAILMALITLMIMGTAAAVLRGQELTGAGEVAKQLQPLFGEWGKALFCIGLFSAAYSSFLVNSMIGGFVLADGLGLGSSPDDKWTRYMTAIVLLTGMGVALYVIQTGVKPVGAIVMAQAVTVIAAPLMAAALLWLCNKKEYMGQDRNGPLLNAVGGIGFVLLLAMAWYTATAKVWPKVSEWLK